uniref:VWFA domain-containing protein n=1 Tax=Gongylonema pulchrum TaxID=637853 RepID=A0A183DAJ5_9BILA
LTAGGEIDRKAANTEKLTKKQRGKLPQSDRSAATELLATRLPPNEVGNAKATPESRSRRISTPTTKRSQGQPLQSSIKDAERSQGHCPRELLFIVDSSGSVQKIYDQQKEYLMSLLNELQVSLFEN